MTNFGPGEFEDITLAPQGLAPRGVQRGGSAVGTANIWANILDTDDALLAIPRGIEGFFQSVYHLSDAVLGDALPDVWDERFLGQSNTFLGGMAEGMTQFLTGFVPGVGLAGKFGKLSRAGKFGQGIRKAAVVGKTKSPILSRLGRDAVVGAGVDFVGFDAHEARLSNFLKDQFGMDNAVTDYLASDADDSEWEGRFKNLLEGGILGVAFDGFWQAIRGYKRMARAKTAGATDDDLLKIRDEVIGDGEGLLDSADKLRKAAEAEQLEQTPPELRPYEAPKIRKVGDVADVTQTRGEGASPDEEIIKNLSKSAKKSKGGVYSVDIEGAESQFYRDDKARVYKMADTDEVLTKRDGSKRDAVAELYRRKQDQSATDAIGSVELKAPRMAPAVQKKVIDFIRKMQEIDDAGGGAFHPRAGTKANPKPVPDELSKVLGKSPNDAALAAFREFVNVENVAPDNEGWTAAVHAATFMLDAATPKDIKPETFIETRAKSMDRLKDIVGSMSDSDILEGVDKGFKTRLEEGLELQRQAAMEADATMMVIQEVSRNTKEAAAKYLASPPEDADKAMLNMLLAIDRETSIVNAVRGHGAVQGRGFNQRKAGFNGAARLEILARRTQLKGRAKEGLDDLARKIAHAPDEKAVAELAQLASRSPTWFDATMEFWINSILSGGRTMSINVLSNAGVAIYRPLEKAVGGFAVAGLPGMKEALLDFQSYVDTFGMAMKVGFDDGKAGVGKFIAGDKIHDITPQHALLAENFGLEGTTRGSIINTLGKMRYAGAVLVGQDSFAKYLSFHANAQHLLRKTHLERQLHQTGKMDPDAARLWASKKVNELTYKNQVLNERVLADKHFDELSATHGDEFTTEQIRAMARDKASEEWNSEDSLLVRFVNQYAGGQALQDTYTNPINRHGGYVERGAAHIQDMAESIPAMKFFVPFIRTPTNILMWAKDRTFDPQWGAIRGWFNSDIKSALRKLRQGEDLGAGLDLITRSKEQQDFLNTLKPSDRAKEVRRLKSEGLKLPNLEKNHNRYLRQMLGDIDLPDGVRPNSPEGRAAIKMAREDALGRLNAGVGIMATLTAVSFIDRGDPDSFHITGRGPIGKAERELLKGTGWMPYSFHVPGIGYIEYRRLDPFATLIGTVADMATIGQYAHNDDQDLMSVIGTSVVGSLMNNVTNKTYMVGLKKMIDMFTNPDQIGRHMAGLAASFVPTGPTDAVNFLAGNEDPHMREVRSLVDAVMNKMTPGYGAIDPQRNFLGEEVQKVHSIGGQAEGRLGQFFNSTVPLAFSATSDDMVGQELANLQHSFMPPRPTRGGLELREFRNEKGQSAYDRMLQLRGEVKVGGVSLKKALRRLIRSNRYKAMDPTSSLEVESPRISEISRIISRYDRASMRQMMREFPDVNQASVDVRRQALQARFSALESIR